MNDCPPKPGFTDISSTMSILSSTWSSQFNGEAGFSTMPGLQPCSRISPIVRSTCSLASGWKVIHVAPALAKSGTMRSTGFTIRCTSIGAVMPAFLSASHTSGPIVRFGT